MFFILFVIFIILVFAIPELKYIVFHLPNTLYWFFKDVYYYFAHKNYNICPEFGKIRCNVASGSQVFGCGKTLSLVRYARLIYKRYDNLDVWSSEDNKLVKQHIHIISNVKLVDIPYIPFVSEEQFTHLDEIFKSNNWGKMDIVIFLLDESGAIFNSRNFRTNISPEFLTKLLQSRKNKMALYMTSQRFQFQDKILRESMSLVTTCKKFWRIVTLRDYDAYEVENCTNTNMLKPVSTRIYLATDLDYYSYDTRELIDKLVKESKDGNNYLDTSEILLTRGGENVGKEFATGVKRRYRTKSR